MNKDMVLLMTVLCEQQILSDSKSEICLRVKKVRKSRNNFTKERVKMKKIMIRIQSLPLISSKSRRKILNYSIAQCLSERVHSDCHFTGDRISIGNRVFINNFCKFFSHKSVGSDIIIEDDVSIGMNCLFTTHSHVIGKSEKRAGDTVFKPIHIKTGTWIGANVTVLPGVTIGEGCIIGGGSVVTKDCIPNNIYVGNPAKKIRELD